MGKIIDEPIAIPRRTSLFQQNSVPTHFRWRGRDYHVEEIGGQWRIMGRWWDGEGERHYVRTVTRQGAALDLCHDMKTGHWLLHEMQD